MQIRNDQDLVLNRFYPEGSHDTILFVSAKGPLHGEAISYAVTGQVKTKDFGRGEGMLLLPAGVAWNKIPGLRSRFIVSDAGSARLVLMDSSANLEPWFSDPDRLLQPEGIAAGSFRDLWVAEPQRRSVLHYDFAGRLLREIRSGGTESFKRPVRVGTDNGGRLIILDQTLGKAFLLNPATNGLIRSFSQLGWGLGFLHNPTDFGILGHWLYVVDAGNKRLAQFSLGGGKSAAYPADGLARVAAFRDECLFGFFETDRSLWVLDPQARRVCRLEADLRSAGAMDASKNCLAISDPQSNNAVILSIDRTALLLQMESRPVR